PHRRSARITVSAELVVADRLGDSGGAGGAVGGRHAAAVGPHLCRHGRGGAPGGRGAGPGSVASSAAAAQHAVYRAHVDYVGRADQRADSHLYRGAWLARLSALSLAALRLLARRARHGAGLGPV